MATAKAIRFRHLESQLNANEKVRFVSRLVNQPNNVIARALFMYFMQSENGESENVNANNILSKIITKRETKASIDSQSNPKLDGLPKQLIGATASFLKQQDYFNLSKTNRSVYLGCNTPNLLQELNLLDIEDYSSINLALYPSVKTMRLKLSKFKDFTFPQSGSSVMNQLESLSVYGEQAETNINELVAQNQFNFSNVSKLELNDFGNLGLNNAVDIDTLYHILSHFNDLHCLTFSRGILNGPLDGQKLKELHPNLNSVELLCRPQESVASVLQTFANQLQRVTIHAALFDELEDLDLSKLNFGKLRSLDIVTPTATCWGGILKTASSLASIHIYRTASYALLLAADAEKMMTKTVTSCKLLDYIECMDEENIILSMMEGIAKGLFQTKMIKRKEMKISIVFREQCKDFKDFVYKVGNVVQWLQNSETQHFVLHLNMLFSGDGLGQLVDELQLISSNTLVKRYDYLIVITNNNRAING